MTPVEWMWTALFVYVAIGVIMAFVVGYNLSENVRKPGGGYWSSLEVTPAAVVLGTFWPVLVVGAFVWGVIWLFINRSAFWPGGDVS